MHRHPAVAGTFYPRSPAAVTAEAAALVAGGAPPAPAIAVVSPHAGWMYSGALAGKLFAGVAVPERVLVIAPNHTGHGPRASVWSADDDAASSWQLPGLDVPVDAAFVSSLLAEAPALERDRDAHEDEHAIEVLLPLIAVRQPKLRLAAIVLGGLSFKECEALGAADRARGAARPTYGWPDADRRVFGHEPLPAGRRSARDRSPGARAARRRRSARPLRRRARARHHDVRLHPGDGGADRGARARRDARDRRRLCDQRRRGWRSRPCRRLRRRPVDA